MKTVYQMRKFSESGKSISERKTLLRRFWTREGEGLAREVLKFVFLHRLFHNQESFSRRIKSNSKKA